MTISRTAVFCCVLAGMVLATTGCTNSGAAKLHGRWDLESPDSLRAVDDKEQQGRMSIIFHRNGKLETITDFAMAKAHKDGKWSLVSFDSEADRLVVACTLNDEQVETDIQFLDDDKIKLIPPNIAAIRRTMTFRRNSNNN